MNLRRLLAEIGLARKPRKLGALQYDMRAGKHRVFVQLYANEADFKEALVDANQWEEGLAAVFSFKKNPPKTGIQGVVAIPFENICVEYLAHEFNHLAFSMAKKNGEEKSVSVAAKLLAHTIGELRDAGYVVPERR